MIDEKVENDPRDFCVSCQRIIPPGGEHDKESHRALPKGTMPYDQVIFVD
jgi:hypothetical protein